MLGERKDATSSNWKLTYEGFDPEEEGLREALTSTGNGYFCTRGAAEWADASGAHYPGTYTHCGFNRETTMMAGHPVLNEDLVNLPNWLVLQLRVEGEQVDLENAELLSYRHELDLRNAVLSRSLRLRDGVGRETTLESRRFVSMANMHQGAIEWKITPENWSGRAEIVTALDGRVTNKGVPRYRELEGRHLDPVSTHTSGPDAEDELGFDIIALMARTRQSRMYVAEAAITRVYGTDGRDVEVDRGLYRMEDYIHQVLAFEAREKETVRVEKMVALYTSRDQAINEPLSNAMKAAGRFGNFESALRWHTQAWDELWEVCDVRFPGDDRIQLLLRTHISHILQVCSTNTAGLDAGAPARGLNGEAYRGHIFWDELYIYPFLDFRVPEVTRELLMYRRRRLDEARAAARASGYRGAMFPWQSGSDGREETQSVHLNPKSGKWDPDLSHNQRHVNAAIFYNIWNYYQATGDEEFLLGDGAEMMLEIARFWSSIAHYDPGRGRYEIHGVMGPDEFHEKYPDSGEEGLRNNAYTNVMVAWISGIAREVLERLPERRRRLLSAKIGLSEEEIELWEDMSRKMFVPFHDDGAGGMVISQFEGYENLEELDWDHYRREYGNIQRLDRILKSEGDEPDRYKLAKQADTLMLFFLFSEEEIEEIFGRLGYEYTADTASRNASYYSGRTTHGSTLSFVVHAGILAGIDPEASWEMFQTALESDIFDIQGGTTQEAIHMGVMAGTLDLIQRGYLGVQARDGTLRFDPRQTERLEGLSFPMRFRGTPLEISLKEGRVEVAAGEDGFDLPVKVVVGGEERELRAGEMSTTKSESE